MDIHIGSSSYLSKNLRKSVRSINISSKKNFKYKYNNFNSKLINKTKFNYVFVVLGKNLKNKNKSLSKKINYKLPLKFLKKLLKTEKKFKIIFFGSFSQYDKVYGKNKDYIIYKSKLLNEINNLRKKHKNFDYVWIYLPNIYGSNQNRGFLISDLIFKMKHNNPIKIKNGLKKIYLLNIKDFVRMISHIKNNWNKYKNNSLFSKYEGPFLLRNISKKIIIQYPKYKGLTIKCEIINEKKNTL